MVEQLSTKANQDWIDRIHNTPVNDNWFSLVEANPNPVLTRKEYEEIAKDFEAAYSTINNDYEFGKKNLGYLGIYNCPGKAKNTTEYKQTLKAFKQTMNTIGGFTNGNYKIVKLDKGTILYRAGNDGIVDSKGNVHTCGSFWTKGRIDSLLMIREKLALCRHWRDFNEETLDSELSKEFNQLTKVYAYELKVDTYAIVGPVAYQGEMYFGNTDILQYYIDSRVMEHIAAKIDEFCLNNSEF